MTTKVDNIINAYANDLEGLTREECLKEDFSAQQCEVLENALNLGVSAEGTITDEKKTALEQAGFAKDFIQDLAGTDGKKALQSRVRWLGDHINTAWYRPDYTRDQRKDMALELANIGPDAKEAIPALIDALKDKDKNIRSDAVSALVEIGPEAKGVFKNTGRQRYFSTPFALDHLDKEAIPALIDALKDTSLRSDVHFSAEMTLAEIGKDAIPALILALKDEEPDVRSKAAYALGEIGPNAKDAVPFLIPALKDQDGLVRFSTAWALGQISPGKKEAVPYLVDALKDEDPTVRSQAVEALRQISPDKKEAIPYLVDALKDKSGNVRSRAAEALGIIGKKAFFAIPVLQEMVVNDPTLECRIAAQEALDIIMGEIR